MQLPAHDIFESCLKTKDYRSFLSEVFSLAEKNDPRFSYAAFSRKAGFTSRGFVKEVVTGRKRMTAYAFPRFVKALGLPTQVKTYFNYLVALEEDELNSDGLTADQIQIRLQQLRAKFKMHLESLNSDSAKSLFKSHQVLEVVSVLGNQQLGLSFDQIARRTRLNPQICAEVLKRLLLDDIAVEKNGRYFSKNPHFVFQGLGKNQGFKEVFLETLMNLRRKVTTSFDSREDLFFQSYFSVEKQRMPELKKRMRDLLQEFVQENENDDGDSVAKLTVGLFQ